MIRLIKGPVIVVRQRSCWTRLLLLLGKGSRLLHLLLVMRLLRICRRLLSLLLLLLAVLNHLVVVCRDWMLLLLLLLREIGRCAVVHDRNSRVVIWLRLCCHGLNWLLHSVHEVLLLRPLLSNIQKIKDKIRNLEVINLS